MDKLAYKRQDFTNNNEVRWCPGCGDYAILAAFQRALPQLGLPPEQHVVVSGIGCAGRFPYYVNTYGFHTIHGRACAVATGLKAMRDDLTVWVVTGDGDALSIGTNHFIHCLRRNVNVNILLVNNQVYGLTKGQHSPTSPQGQVTKTSPQGVTSQPLNPLKLALSVGATFVARALDKDPNHLASILKQAHEHPGCSLIEIYQDCNIFNKGAFDAFAIKNNRAENTLLLEPNQPMIFGAEKDHCISLKSGRLQRGQSNPLHHDTSDWKQAMLLASLSFPAYPVPLGVYFQKQEKTLCLTKPIRKKPSDLMALFRANASWNA